MPKVSIVVPVYKVEKYISRCVESLINQTLNDIEMIFVDDCTPDRSVDILKSYSSKDFRIRILHHKKNRGLMQARQTGYENAIGDFILFCDSDDSLNKDSIELLYLSAIRNNADLVIGNYTVIGFDGVKKIKVNSLKYGLDIVSIYKSLLRGECAHSLCGKIYNRDLFCNYIYETKPNCTNGEDAILFYQLVSNTQNVSVINESVYNYYQNETSSTHVRLSENALDCIYFANDMIRNIVSAYPDLQNDLYRCLIFRHIKSITSNYSRELICTLEEKYKLGKYYSVKNIFRYFSFRERIRIFKLLIQTVFL